MITTTPTVNKTCCLRIIDDILNHTEMVEIDRERGEVLTKLLLMAKYLREAQSLVRLTLHVSPKTITIHWRAKDLNCALAICSMGTIPTRALECLKIGEVIK
jgi:hypothetical protein